MTSIETSPPVSVIILMGVSGCGKTAVGKALSKVLGWEFIESDDYHSDNDIRKMSSNIPLTDEDRWPWLEVQNRILMQKQAEGIPVILASSALKVSYREMMCRGLVGCAFVYLKGGYDLIWERMNRRAHFMKPSMLQSQFDDLEEPIDAFTVNIIHPVPHIVEQIINRFHLHKWRTSSA
jgi:gluconokinase